MVARTPQKQRKVAMVVPSLNSDVLKETINKVDKCMERLQELQYTIAGGTKVVSGVNLSPRSTRTYLKTSLRCKQETLRIKNATHKKSPVGKFPASSPGDWRKMSLPAMLLGETVNEILQTSQVTREIVQAIAPKKSRKSRRLIMSQEDDGPKTPETERKSREPIETVSSNIKARRKKEKQNRRSESDSPPSLRRARSRIAFRTISPQKKEENVHVKRNGRNSFLHLANRVSPKHKPWDKKAVLFPNPLFISGTATLQAKFSRTMSPVIVSNEISSIKNNKETPHKFLIKFPPSSASKFQVKIKSPPKVLVSPTRNGSNLVRRRSPSGSSFPTRNVNIGKKSPTASISPVRNLGKRSPKLSTAAKLRRSFTPMRNGSSKLARKSSISPKRVTLQAFISPARNGNFCKKKSPRASISPTKVNKSQKLSTAAKLRRSFSPSRLAMRLVSPMKSRKSVAKCDDHEVVSGLKQRPILVPKRFSMGRI